METTSPRLIEYGKLVDTKNGWKTLNFDGCRVKPKPVIGSTEKPVMIHDVIVSGTFFKSVTFVVLKIFKIGKKIQHVTFFTCYVELKSKLSNNQVSGNSFLISITFDGAGDDSEDIGEPPIMRSAENEELPNAAGNEVDCIESPAKPEAAIGAI
jgi:hypothetical protein